ncbi:MAG: glycoside hydrolase domain-containing protein [Myxococcota bacterium]
MFWGVDSYGPADREFRVPAALREQGENEHTRITLFEFVRRRMGQPPQFWGRYINRRLPQDRHGTVLSPENSHSLTPREVGFLHAHECRVLLVYNGSTGRSAAAHRLTGGRRGGHDAAAHAHALCEQLGAPPHAAVYADAENWPGDVAWLRAWYETLQTAQRRAGVYGRPNRVVENPADASRQYGTPLDQIRSANTRRLARERIEWRTRWGGSAPRRVTVRDYWGEELSEAMTDVLVDQLVEEGRDPFRGRAANPFLVWSNEPRRVFNEADDATLDGTDIPNEFVPAEPPGASGVRTVVWQYLENALFRGGNRGTVDMNMATHTGFNSMW